MKITIFTIGTRGDVEPFVALGAGLKRSGHQVKVATHGMFEQFIREQGLDFALITGNVHEVLNSEEGGKALNKKVNTFAIFRHLKNAAAPLVVQALKEATEALKDADHILCTPLTLYMAYFLSQEMNKPISIGSVNPAGPTRFVHNILFPPAPTWFPQFLQRFYNLNSHLVVGELVWQAQRPLLNRAWKEVRGASLPRKDPLPAAFRKDPPLLMYAYSPQVLEKPIDWAESQRVTGYWFLESGKTWTPPQELEDFINAGPEPIYIGFGSMNNTRHKEGALKSMILEAIKRTGQRAVILNHGFDLKKEELTESIFATETVPFAYLFPKMAAVVHHGGAGTTAIGLWAGVPSIITPLINDQRFWSWRVHGLGVGPKPIKWNDLNADKLEAAIHQAVSDGEMIRKADELGKKIRAENGVEEAVRIFNSYFGQSANTELKSINHGALTNN